MNTPFFVKNRLRTKSCLITSTNCCCAKLFDEIKSTRREVNEILLFLRENFPLKTPIVPNELQCDLLIDLSEEIASDQGSSSVKFQRKYDLPEPQFEVTYECSPSPSVSATNNESKVDEIIFEFDPLFVNHESKSHKKYNNDGISEGTKYSTLCRPIESNKKRKSDLIPNFDGSKSPRTETSPRHESNSELNQSKRQKKSPEINEKEPLVNPEEMELKNSPSPSLEETDKSLQSMTFSAAVRPVNCLFERRDDKSNDDDTTYEMCSRKIQSKELSSICKGTKKEFNLDKDFEFDGKQSLPDCSSGDTDDEDLDSSPVVKIPRLPNFMIGSTLTASKIGQIYSIVEQLVHNRNRNNHLSPPDETQNTENISMDENKITSE